MKNLFSIPERLDPEKENVPLAEKILHASRYEYASWVINRFYYDKKIVVLDAACGVGYGSKILKNKTKQTIIGVDLDKSLIKKISKTNKIRFIQADIKKMPFVKETIDCIVCFETIEHLSKNGGIDAIKEFKRVLKKNGLIIISSPNKSLTTLIKKILPGYNNPFHFYEYKTNELTKILKQNDFKIIQRRGQYLFFPLIYFFFKYLSFFNFIFKPSFFYPLCFSRYFILVGQKLNKRID